MRVLVSGAGIAGLSLGLLLERRGVEVVIAERARRLEPLGHYIGLKGNGVRTVERMGLLDACRAREQRLDGVRFHTPSGRLLRENRATRLERELGGVLFFRRADLHAALHEAVAGKVELRLGTEVQALEAGPERVEVRLSDGRSEAFDALIGADGVRSPTRARVFGSGHEVPLGGRYIALTVEVDHGLDPRFVAAYLGRGQMVGLIPIGPRVASPFVYHADGGEQPASRSAADVRDFLLRACGDFGAPVRRTFEAIDASSYVFTDSITMVRPPRIVKGRVALLGDAAACPTFLSGMGSALALQGAYHLARALEEHPGDVPAALLRYEAGIRPIAARYQQSAWKMRGFVLGRSRVRAAVRDAALAWMPDRLFVREAQRFYAAERAASPA
ncbi:FAD dependent oxidoreductase [Sorangium cellulosum]|uniref:FAD dependent oxidoreductase n=1 Tax=Sorangium cellulosum TaxID=56 RepID=A0A4V0NEJ9_SORCE|nr:FAD-dependent monooxygenase [Sorangium cellulosum]AUX26432.1 FAD dependent oxidoreductase [Sorangium cellulosum]